MHTHVHAQWGDIKTRTCTPENISRHHHTPSVRSLLWESRAPLTPEAAAADPWLSPCHKENILCYTVRPMDTVCISMRKHRRRKAERSMNVPRHTYIKGKLVARFGSLTLLENYKRMPGKTNSKQRGQDSLGNSTWPKGLSNVIKIIIARKGRSENGKSLH